MRSILLFLVAVFSLYFLVSCTDANAHEAETQPCDKHVIILAFDGWGASSFEMASMPFLKSKIPESAWTVHKRSILPTSSACNWATMFKGIGPEAHGYIAWNTQTPAFDISFTDEKGNFPSVFSIYRRKYPGREMGYFYQWEGMKYIFDLDDFSSVKGFSVTLAGSEMMKDHTVSYIKEKKPGLACFVWDYPDKTGHSVGWYTPEYMSELSHIDTIIEAVVNSCVEAGIIDKTLFIVTSDHGGHDKTHHQPLISDLETPFVLFGQGVKAQEITVPLMQYDVASIIADYLSLDQPVAWRGKTPVDLFM